MPTLSELWSGTGVRFGSSLHASIAANMLRQVREQPETDTTILESSLIAYAKTAWSLIEPGTPLIWGWHLDATCEHLQVVPDEIQNLLITIPPRSGKCTIIDHIALREDFTAWGSRALTGDERCTRHAR
jgi:hypothetical protein